MDNLTKRECETLTLLAEGHTIPEAAELMGVSVKTVKSHSYNLQVKLDIHDRATLVHYALHHGLATNVYAEVG